MNMNIHFVVIFIDFSITLLLLNYYLNVVFILIDLELVSVFDVFFMITFKYCVRYMIFVIFCYFVKE